MDDIVTNIGIGVVGSLIATIIAAISIFLAVRLFSAESYVSKAVVKLEELERYSNDLNLLYIATLRDLIVMNALFFADSALWNIGEVLVHSSDLQEFVLLIDLRGLLSIRVFSVVTIMIGIWVALKSILRINSVLAFKGYQDEPKPASKDS